MSLATRVLARKDLDGGAAPLRSESASVPMDVSPWAPIDP